MPKKDQTLDRIRKICLALPDTKETLTWGKPHFRVGEKIFAGYGEEQGKPVLGFKLAKEHAAAVVKIPGFWPAPYVGHKGWVSMDVSSVNDWSMLGEMIRESYELIAPKKSLAKLAGEAPPEPTQAAANKKKKTASRAAVLRKAPRSKSTTRKRGG